MADDERRGDDAAVPASGGWVRCLVDRVPLIVCLGFAGVWTYFFLFHWLEATNPSSTRVSTSTPAQTIETDGAPRIERPPQRNPVVRDKPDYQGAARKLDRLLDDPRIPAGAAAERRYIVRVAAEFGISADDLESAYLCVRAPELRGCGKYGY